MITAPAPALLIAFVLSAMAQDHALYVNGVQAEGLRSYDFKSVNVRIDEQGAIWIDAPQYRVEVQGAASQAGKATQAPSATAPVGRYWLVSQDNQSKGHEIEVLVNGVLVQKIRSGDSQLILDLGRYLKPGANTIVFNAMPANALDGGILNIFVGTGNNDAGTLNLDAPTVSYSRRATDPVAGGSRSYQLEVK